MNFVKRRNYEAAMTEVSCGGGGSKRIKDKFILSQNSRCPDGDSNAAPPE
jgi:hypothetical protein